MAAKEGRFLDVLALAEAVLTRTPDDQDAHMIAVIAACNSDNAAAAQKHLGSLRSPGRRAMGKEICKRTLGRPAEDSAPATCMDEIACLLADRPPACCQRYRVNTER